MESRKPRLLRSQGYCWSSLNSTNVHTDLCDCLHTYTHTHTSSDLDQRTHVLDFELNQIFIPEIIGFCLHWLQTQDSLACPAEETMWESHTSPQKAAFSSLWRGTNLLSPAGPRPVLGRQQIWRCPTSSLGNSSPVSTCRGSVVSASTNWAGSYPRSSYRKALVNTFTRATRTAIMGGIQKGCRSHKSTTVPERDFLLMPHWVTPHPLPLQEWGGETR